MDLDNMGEGDGFLASDMEADLSEIDLEQFISYDDYTALQLFHFLFEVLSSNTEKPYRNFSQQDKHQMIPCFFSVLLKMSPSLNSLKIMYR